jgi:thiamine biosynthesis lipoprotein
LTCQAAAPATATPWPQNFAVQIRYEIPRIDGADYTRPYVVAWISDAERKLVRTLFVLGDRARWRQNNYVWQRRFERFTPDAVQAVSRPTRAPGRYDLIWDGLDNNGRAVGQGHYTLTIEAAREHGGHSIQVIDLDLGAAPLQQSAPAQPEIGAVSARYGARP